jgi:tetratricopeptide (TPR) repeat protein
VNQTVIGEINMKCYEVPAAGTCLFVEEDNLDIDHYLVDGESVVLFRRENLREKILYYLRHEDERAAIAQAGREVMSARSYRANMQDIVERLREIGREQLMGMGREIAKADPVQCAGHYLSYAARHSGYGLQQALDLARVLSDDLGSRKALLQGTLQYTACSAPIDQRTGRRWQGVWPSEEIFDYVRGAWEDTSDDLSLNLAWAQIAGSADDFARQLPALDRLVDQLEAGCRVPLGGTNLYTLPQAYRFVFERRAWEEVERGVPPDATLRGILLEYAYGLRARVYTGLGRYDDAIEDLRSAVAAHPTSVLTRPLLVDRLMERGLREEATEIGLAHLEQAPLDVPMRVRLVENELRRERPETARQLLERALRISRVFCDDELVARLRQVQERAFRAPGRQAALNA